MSMYYGNRKIKSVYLGTQNTNCLTHIPQDINLELDPLNATVTGAITNSNGILSAFNTGVYASTEIKETGNEDIIFKAKVTTHKTYNTIFSSVTKKCAVAFNSAGKLCLKLVDWQGGKTAYSTGTWVWCRFVWDGSKVYIYTLADNSYTLNTLPELSSWTLEYSTSKSNGYFGGDTLNIGWSNISTNYYFNGSIDITQSQIKIGGSVIWKGGTGKLTLKKGSKVYVPNGWTEQKETTVTETYECFTSVMNGNNFYCYFKTPYKVGDYVYTDGGNEAIVNSAENLVLSTTYISAINNDGSVDVTTVSGFLFSYTRYPAGDLTKTTTTIVGSGDRVFKEVVISSDITSATSSASDTNERMLAVRSDGKGFNLVYTTESGTGYTGTGNVIYYNTAKNLVERYSSGTLQSYNLSFPIARIKADGSVYYGSISQVFNGFGHIGSIGFALPRVKGLVANGFNTDGTYKSKEIEIKSVITYNSTYNQTVFTSGSNLSARNKYYEVNTYNDMISKKLNGLYYVRQDNKCYSWAGGSGVVYEGYLRLYDVLNEGDVNKITSLTPNPVQPEKIGRKIARIYKGSTLVYGYGINEVIFEQSAAGDYSLDIKVDGYYQLWLVGGGGGGAFNSSGNSGSSAAGNSGGYVNVKAYLKKGSYTITVGAGGNASGGIDANAWGGNGSSSIIKLNDNTLVLAGGGTGNHVWWRDGYAYNEVISTPNEINSDNFTLTETIENQVGNAGGLGGNGSSPTGGASRYGDYGKGGNVYNRNSADAGGNGYVKVVAI